MAFMNTPCFNNSLVRCTFIIHDNKVKIWWSKFQQINRYYFLKKREKNEVVSRLFCSCLIRLNLGN